MQICDIIRIARAVPEADSAGCDIIHYEYENDSQSETTFKVSPSAQKANAPSYIMSNMQNEGEYWVHFANFGSGFGPAYVFIDRSSNPPRISWFWHG
jgi:hypothetical protein